MPCQVSLLVMHYPEQLWPPQLLTAAVILRNPHLQPEPTPSPTATADTWMKLSWRRLRQLAKHLLLQN